MIGSERISRGRMQDNASGLSRHLLYMSRILVGPTTELLCESNLRLSSITCSRYSVLPH